MSASTRRTSPPRPPTPSGPGDFLPLTPAVFHVLLALADGERHGYAIMQAVAETTGGGITMGPGTLYGTLKRLLDSGLVEEHDQRPDPELDDERRRYYRLTALGQQVAAAESRRLETLVRAARRKGLLPKPSTA
jgi:DNA-binding PadR family transcriptional regulator